MSYTGYPLTASAGVVGSLTIPQPCKLLLITDRTGTAEVFLTKDGSTPTVTPTANTVTTEFYMPATLNQIKIGLPKGPSQDDQMNMPAVVLKAISSAALSLWVEVWG